MALQVVLFVAWLNAKRVARPRALAMGVEHSCNFAQIRNGVPYQDDC